MVKCWHPNPKERPTFQELAHVMDSLLSAEAVSAFNVTRPSFLGGYHPTLKLSGIPTLTFIVSLTHRMDNI